MPVNHLLLALAVVFVWGTNFVVIRWGLDGLPPFLFATLRFAFLDVEKCEAARRLSTRATHFFNASLIDSQFATLESPVGEPVGASAHLVCVAKDTGARCAGERAANDTQIAAYDGLWAECHRTSDAHHVTRHFTVEFNGAAD